ncbi:hypothetical protein ANCDUO_16327 [Ancylostoma duodenale]|uniref:Uncharacterized protein n=1 Tax=Ancylostoma duodenale TaxID=51022 RepID=A0A0C2FY78_9BILA|nr:hypothetical protein ANCDUO_16327 [Ancylostoma duodenale]
MKEFRLPGIVHQDFGTAAYGLLGHASLRRTFDRRAAVRLADGTTVTFDVFEPINKHKVLAFSHRL